MKVTNIAIYALAAITLVGCAGETEKVEEVVVEELAPVVAEYTLDTENSKLSWKGIEPAEDEFHTGYISLSEGKAVTTDGNLTSGSFVIDMNTITVTDLEGEGKGKLEAHLKGTREGTAEHFFNVPKYPTVTVDVVSFDEGNLTIKLGMLGQELTETIPVELSEEGNEASITGAFEMDFSPLNIPYLMPAEGEEESKISPMIEFELDLKLKK